FTVDFEYLYFFTKKPQYYFEQQFEPASFPNQGKWTQGDNKGYQNNQDMPARKLHEHITGDNRNKRCVWQLSTQSYPDAHFATYPEKLCETPIKAGCPGHICKITKTCKKCGKEQ
ncbi:hypothetical protein LCGC14_2801540, partial [marine sediment metagenome]